MATKCTLAGYQTIAAMSRLSEQTLRTAASTSAAVMICRSSIVTGLPARLPVMARANRPGRQGTVQFGNAGLP